MNVFWDIDETLIFTDRLDPNQEHVKFLLHDGHYYTIIRPSSKALINYSRQLFGENNVYVLTTATSAYANEVNRLADWGFDHSHLITREEIDSHTFHTAYSGTATARHKLFNNDNILIDNLDFRYNHKKTNMMGILKHNYFKVQDYYGVNYPDDSFEEDVKQFLQNRIAKTLE